MSSTVFANEIFDKINKYKSALEIILEQQKIINELGFSDELFFCKNYELSLRKIEGLKELISKDCKTLNKDDKELYIKTLEELISNL